jgi:hypothetical protein
MLMIQEVIHRSSKPVLIDSSNAQSEPMTYTPTRCIDHRPHPFRFTLADYPGFLDIATSRKKTRTPTARKREKEAGETEDCVKHRSPREP